MTQILDELDNRCDMHSVDAALKRHEVIHTDVDARVSSVVFNSLFKVTVLECCVNFVCSIKVKLNRTLLVSVLCSQLT